MRDFNNESKALKLNFLNYQVAVYFSIQNFFKNKKS